jgi:hypothetical protein
MTELIVIHVVITARLRWLQSMPRNDGFHCVLSGIRTYIWCEMYSVVWQLFVWLVNGLCQTECSLTRPGHDASTRHWNKEAISCLLGSVYAEWLTPGCGRQGGGFIVAPWWGMCNITNGLWMLWWPVCVWLEHDLMEWCRCPCVGGRNDEVTRSWEVIWEGYDNYSMNWAG